MTRNRELDCEDLFECAHEAETAVSDLAGNIIAWTCRCGKTVKVVDEKMKASVEKSLKEKK
jgi:hypothetical protein